MAKVNIVDIATQYPVTVKRLREQLALLPDESIVVVGSCCGTHLYNGKPEQELGRFLKTDKHRTVNVDYFPEAEQDADDDQLFGVRQSVVILR